MSDQQYQDSLQLEHKLGHAVYMFFASRKRTRSFVTKIHIFWYAAPRSTNSDYSPTQQMIFITEA